MSNIRDLGLADAALGIALLLVGFLTVYSIWLMLMTTAFWFVKVENITELFNGLFRAAQFPVTAFPGWLRLFFSFVVPIAFITTVPAEAFIGRIQPQSIMLSIAVTLILFVVSRLVWMRALSKYTSASS
jgi:ABC-2 type transport system permease protein